MCGRSRRAPRLGSSRHPRNRRGPHRRAPWRWKPSLAGVYLDRRLLAFTRGVRLRIAGTVVLGLLQVVAGIARLAFLG